MSEDYEERLATYEYLFEVCPEDVEALHLEIYREVALLPLPHVEWIGFSLQPLGFGISFVMATCRAVQHPDTPDGEAIEGAISALACVQRAQLKRQRTLDEDDMDPFDLGWLHRPRPFDGESASPKCGIVATFRDAPCLASWVRFHIAVGFSRIWLYVDDPSTSDMPEALALQEATGAVLTVVPRDDELRKAWKRLTGWKKYGPAVDSVGDRGAVMARQCLNGEHAAELAQAEGCEWLLHIDVDELACPASSGTSTAQIFGHADAAGANAVIFPNHEVAPEGEGPYADPFKEATLFKFNETLRPPGKGNSRFLAYANGKSAIKLGCSVRPDGVHKWTLPSPAVMLLSPDNGFLLHYVNCGFDFFKRKFEILGAFKDQWFGRDIQSTDPFCLVARDAAQKGEQALLKVYREHVMYDADRAQTLLDDGALVRSDLPSQLLAEALPNGLGA